MCLLCVSCSDLSRPRQRPKVTPCKLPCPALAVLLLPWMLSFLAVPHCYCRKGWGLHRLFLCWLATGVVGCLHPGE